MAERRIVTVLFADVVGFTSLSEALDIEELAIVQEGYFAAVREVLERYGGHLEKFIGDAVVAVFGVPRAREDDAVRAVRAAIALHARAAAISSELGLEPGTLLLRVGCNTGEVAYDPGQGRVTGDAVNVAARLQAAAPTGRVLVGPDTALAVAETVELEPMGNLDLKGKEAEVRGSVVAGIRDQPSRAAALGLLRGRTVGRGADLQALEEFALDRTDEADWRLVVAPPGVGKSRLVAELRRRLLAADQPVRVLGAQCTPEATHPHALEGDDAAAAELTADAIFES